MLAVSWLRSLSVIFSDTSVEVPTFSWDVLMESSPGWGVGLGLRKPGRSHGLSSRWEPRQARRARESAGCIRPSAVKGHGWAPHPSCPGDA